MRKTKWVGMLAAGVLVLLGFSFLYYPHWKGETSNIAMKKETQKFYDRPAVPTAPIHDYTHVDQPDADMREYADLWYAVTAYNDRLWREEQIGLCDPWSYQQPSFYLEAYGMEGEVFAVLTIPKLSLEMPVYLGATDEHLADGAAHLSQTSLPVGGPNTNCVIAGHRGWKGAAYFRYITDLKPGDQVVITNLWETLTYQVTDTIVIEPNDIEKIMIQEGRDMVTLLTCHPYASGGKQRYLVYCERVPGA